MTTITVRLSGICSGGNHLTFTISGSAVQYAAVVAETIRQQIDAYNASVSNG